MFTAIFIASLAALFTTTTALPATTTTTTTTTTPPPSSENNKSGPWLLKSKSTSKCFVSEGTAWPVLGDCESDIVLQVYVVNGEYLKTKDGWCLVMDTFDSIGSSKPYLIDCTYDSWGDEVKKFTVPFPNGQLRLKSQPKCVVAGSELTFADCNKKEKAQNWELAPLGSECRAPGDVWTIDSSDYDERLDMAFFPITFSWASLPDNVESGSDFKVTMCLTSYPEDGKEGVVEQCVTRNQWDGTSIEVPIDAATVGCRRHFSVVYETACGKGRVTEEVFGCVGLNCPDVCAKMGSLPSPAFPTA